ncbi:hypothetical protein I4U23_031320 [Adineta vaga]|nr:hypothetical protein I4U23_031320 [Adineta vaga]
MSSSNTSMSDAVNIVKQIQNRFSIYWSIFLFSFGIIGHSLSIYVFTRRTLFWNPCILYFLALTIGGYVIVCGTVPLRFLQVSFIVDVFVTSDPMCKILTYIFGCARVLPSWFVLLASIDRFLCSSSSTTLRSWSSIRVASRAILLVVLFISLIYIHLPILFAVQLPQKSCVVMPGASDVFRNFCNLILWSWLPTLGMFVFGSLTIRHVRQGRRRILPQNTGNQRKTDTQLIKMMLVQASVFGSTAAILPSINLYITLTAKSTDDALKKATDNLLLNVFSYVALTGPCLSFYLFILSSQLFRRELMKLFKWRPRTQNQFTVTVGPNANYIGLSIRHRIP